jgi:hypothetical protein
MRPKSKALNRLFFVHNKDWMAAVEMPVKIM